MSEITVAATQMACTWDRDANIKQAEDLVRAAAGDGAQIVLLQELFETPYFPAEEKQELFALARPFEDNPVIGRFAELALDRYWNPPLVAAIPRSALIFSS